MDERMGGRSPEIRKIVPQATVDEKRVQVSGDLASQLPDDYVYIDKGKGKIFDGRRGDRITDLPRDSVEVPRTTWWRC